MENLVNEQVEQTPAQEIATPEQNQSVTVEQVQPEELPAASVIQAPQATPVQVPAGTINNQGILDTQIEAAPPTEEEIPDSERR